MPNKTLADSRALKRKLFQTIVHDAPIAYALIDKSYRVVFMNDYFLRSRKQDWDRVAGNRCYNLIGSDQPCHICNVRDVFEQGTSCKKLRKEILPDASHMYSDDLAVPIRDPDTGTIEYVLQILIDRTAEMDLRERNFASFLKIIHSLVRLLEEKDYATCLHSRHVSAICAKLTRYLNLGPEAVFNATLGGLLHDLGKLYIPDAVLNKEGTLDDREYAIIMEHPVFTWVVLSGLSSFKPMRDVAIAHHERWDGKGNPKGVSGEDIPIEGRITAIADTYDAMTCDRPYRPGLSHEAAMAEIKKVAGTQLDPQLVEQFVAMVEEYGYDRDTLTDGSVAFREAGLIVEEYNDSDNELPVSRWEEVKAPSAEDYVLYVHMPNAQGAAESPSAVPQHGGVAAFDKATEDLLASDEFIDSVLNHTPAFYTLVDEAWNVLYVSDNFAAAIGRPRNVILAGKCFHISDKKEPCFTEDGGFALCPPARAFATGEKQRSLLEKESHARRYYTDQYAIPTEIEGPDGKTIRCCLEILFDRSREKNSQYAFEHDVKLLIKNVRNMLEEILPDVSANSHHIVHEIHRFCDYLSSIKIGPLEPFLDPD